MKTPYPKVDFAPASSSYGKSESAFLVKKNTSTKDSMSKRNAICALGIYVATQVIVRIRNEILLEIHTCQRQQLLQSLS